jgi:hypothetical protein
MAHDEPKTMLSLYTSLRERTDRELAIFEVLTLGVFEHGLSWSIVFVGAPTPPTGFGSPRSTADLPTTTPEADALTKQMKSQGYRFGPTSVYALMQNVGVVNDHIHGCFRASATGRQNDGEPDRRCERIIPRIADRPIDRGIHSVG